jgi:hypothetical protein
MPSMPARSSMAVLMLACALAIPAFCQKEQGNEPDSAQARELKACGPKLKKVNYAASTDKNTHPTGEPAADKALIYILRSRYTGVVSSGMNGISTELAVEGEFKGVNQGGGYFFFMLEPGVHYFCSESRNRNVLVLTVEAGKTYYLEPIVHGGGRKLNYLTVLGDEEGKTALAKVNPSTWRVK